MQQKKKIIRTSTIPIALNNLLRGQLAFLDKHYEVVAVSGDDENLRAVEEREGVRVIPVAMHRSIKPLHDLVSLWKLFWLFKKEKPFLVHSITPKAGLLTMTAGWMARVPVRCHTFTGLIFPYKSGALQTLLIAMDKLLCRFATTIYPEGQGVRAHLLEYNITKKPLRVIGNGNINGIDIDFYDRTLFTESEIAQTRSSLGILPNDFVFLFVGRLVGDKGISELVTAFTSISGQYQNARLLLVGNYETDLDPLPANIVQTIEDHDKIISTGFLHEVRPLYASAQVNVLPSYREGFPNVVLQAGSMGLPQIVTDISGSNEIITDQKNGLIVPPKDASALALAMSRLLSDAQLLSDLSRDSRLAIASRFSQQQLWEHILAEYARLECEHRQK